MLIFAWILWGIYVLGYSIGTALIVGAICAANDGREVKINFKPVSFLINLAVFVFLNLYLFL